MCNYCVKPHVLIYYRVHRDYMKSVFVCRRWDLRSVVTDTTMTQSQLSCIPCRGGAPAHTAIRISIAEPDGSVVMI